MRRQHTGMVCVRWYTRNISDPVVVSDAGLNDDNWVDYTMKSPRMMTHIRYAAGEMRL